MDKLITAEEYAEMPGLDGPTELVRGRILYRKHPIPLHEYVCAEIASQIGMYIKLTPIGRVIGNNSGVITSRSPDSVRGPDVSYFSFERLPRSSSLRKYPDAPPNIAFEVKSPSDRPGDVLEKVGEYLNIGVDVVVVVDPAAKQAVVYSQDRPERILSEEGVLEFPGLLPGLSISLAELWVEGAE